MLKASVWPLPDARWEELVTGSGLALRWLRRPTEFLYHHNSGDLVGMLLFHPCGSFEVMVREDQRRRGIGTQLLARAIGKWKIDLEKQAYTPEGAALVNEFIRRQYASPRTTHQRL